MHSPGWYVGTHRSVTITDTCRNAMLDAWTHLAFGAIEERRKGNIRYARGLAKSARQLVHAYGKRSADAGPIVGHA